MASNCSPAPINRRLMSEFIHEEKFIIVHCCECSIAFGIIEEFYNKRRRDHKLFSCPAGHEQYFSGESDLEKAKRLAREAEEKAERLRLRLDNEKRIIRRRDYQVRHYKGEVTKLKRRK